MPYQIVASHRFNIGLVPNSFWSDTVGIHVDFYGFKKRKTDKKNLFKSHIMMNSVHIKFILTRIVKWYRRHLLSFVMDAIEMPQHTNEYLYKEQL